MHADETWHARQHDERQMRDHISSMSHTHAHISAPHKHVARSTTRTRPRECDTHEYVSVAHMSTWVRMHASAR